MRTTVTAEPRKDEDYLSNFNMLLRMLDSFQSKQHASEIFGFLNMTASYDESGREEVLRIEYPHLADFHIKMKILDKALETKYYRVSKIEARQIAKELISKMERVHGCLEKESVKKRLHSEFCDWNPYRIIDHKGIQMREVIPGAWPGFKISMVDRGNLAIEYHEWLQSRYDLLIGVLEKFEAGEYSKPLPKKGTNKNNNLRQGIIFEDRWADFIRLCDSLSDRKIVIKEREIQFVTYDSVNDAYRWERRNIPALGQFITKLLIERYFEFPAERGGKYDVCRNYLSYFGYPTDDKYVKYLSKEINNTSNHYIGIF